MYQFLNTAVLEAKDVNSEILNSLSEQRRLLANSAQKEEEVGTFYKQINAQVSFFQLKCSTLSLMYSDCTGL